MGSSLRHCLLALAVVVGAGAAPARGEDPPVGITAALEPGPRDTKNPPPRLTLKFPAEAQATDKLTAVIFLRANTGKPKEQVKLLPQLTPAPGQSVEPPAVTLRSGGAELPAAGLEIDAGAAVPVIVQVGNLAEPGSFTGSLIAGRDGRWAAVVTLTIERPSSPRLRVVGAPASGAIALEQNVAEFRHRFFVESTNEATVEARVVVQPLVGPDGAEANVTVTVSAADPPAAPAAVAQPPTLGAEPGAVAVQLNGLRPIALDVSARLDRAGKYTGALTLVYAKTRESIAFEVNRKREPPTVDVLGVEPAYVDSRTGPVLWITLHEKAGQAVNLDRPVLTTFARKRADQSKAQGPFGAISVSDEGGQPIDSVKLKPGETRRLRIRVPAVSEPGEYTGTIQFAGPDYTALVAPVALLARQPAWIAAAWIIAGIIPSFLLRLYLKTYKPRMIKQRDILRLLSEIDNVRRRENDLTAQEAAAVDWFQGTLTSLHSRLDDGPQPGADTKIAQIDRRLTLFPKWINSRRQVKAIDPARIQETFVPMLDAVGAYLVQDNESETEFQAAKATLDGMDAKIVAAVKKALQEQIPQFRATLEAYRQTADAEALAQLAALNDELEEADHQVDAASDLAAIGRARSTFQRARITFGAMLADALRAKLHAVAPRGFTARQWDDLKKDVIGCLDRAGEAVAAGDADHASRAYADAVRLYVSGVIAPLRRSAQETADAIDKKLPSLTEEAKLKFSKLKADAEKVDAQAAKALDDLKAGRLEEAQQGYEAARQALDALRAELTSAGILGGAAGGAGGVFATLGRLIGVVDAPAGVAPTTTSAARVALPLETAKGLTRTILLLETLSALAIGTIAVVIGLQLLWVNDFTWGGWGSWCVALLWGLGMHQVTGASVQSMTGITQELAK